MSARLEIVLHAGPLVVLRNADGVDESSRAVLGGVVVLRVHEPTDVRDVRLAFTGRARLHIADSQPPYRNHSLDDELHREEISLMPSMETHTHTLQAGSFDFPFEFTVPQDLPASVRTITNAASIEYRLKACAPISPPR